MATMLRVDLVLTLMWFVIVVSGAPPPPPADAKDSSGRIFVFEIAPSAEYYERLDVITYWFAPASFIVRVALWFVATRAVWDLELLFNAVKVKEELKGWIVAAVVIWLPVPAYMVWFLARHESEIYCRHCVEDQPVVSLMPIVVTIGTCFCSVVDVSAAIITVINFMTLASIFMCAAGFGRGMKERCAVRADSADGAVKTIKLTLAEARAAQQLSSSKSVILSSSQAPPLDVAGVQMEELN
jgi:hypothetical protein